MMSEIKEIGPLAHETRAFCFGLNSGKRLWVLSAGSAEVRDQWIAVLRTFQPKQMEAGSKVPHTAIGSIKKTLMKKSKTESSGEATSNSSTAISHSTSGSHISITPALSPPSSSSSYNAHATSPRAAQTQTASSSSPAASTSDSSSTSPQASTSTTSTSTTSTSTANSATASTTTVTSLPIPQSGAPPSSEVSPGVPTSLTSATRSPPTSSVVPAMSSTPTTSSVAFASPRYIQSNEPRATHVFPTTFSAWTPKLAWNPTPERPAWCYELAPGVTPELSAWLSPLLSAATRFNMGWAYILDWVRRIGNPAFSNALILDSIKQGLSKLTPCWNEFERARGLAESWDATHGAVAKLRNQISELHGLVDAKVAGWHVQLAHKTADEGMEFTYVRDQAATPERPAWYFIPSVASTEVGEAFKIFERAASIFNDNWQLAFEASKGITGTTRTSAPGLKDTISKSLAALEPCWKEFDAAVSAFEAWNTVSLYTLEVKQQVSSLRRLYDSHKRDWLAQLDSRSSFVPHNKTDYVFEHDRVSTADRPAWGYKFNLQTPGEISRGLLVLSTASNIFNSNWAVAFEWANKIGKNMATRAAIREGILESFRTLENSWPHFENAITMLEQWESAASEVIRQVSQLRGLVEESKDMWLGKLATSQEITGFSPIGENFRLSGFATDAWEATSAQTSPTGPQTPTGSISGSSMTTMMMTPPSASGVSIAVDARSIYENTLAANREAASIADLPDTKLNFVPGLGPGSFRNVDIYRTVLKELYRAQQLPDVQNDVLEKIRALVVETQQRHRDLCFKWAVHFAREGNMARSLEYYEALHEVLPDACVELDRELMALKAEFSAGNTDSVSLATM